MKYKTLIIEDNWSERKQVYFKVFNDGFDIDAVETASELLTKTRKSDDYDLIVIDIVLSNFRKENKEPVDLFDVLEEIGTYKPIILVSSEFGALSEKNGLPPILTRIVEYGYNIITFLDWHEFKNEGSDEKVIPVKSKIIFNLEKFYKYNPKNTVDVAIISALEEELAPFKNRVIVTEKKTNGPYDFNFARMENKHNKRLNLVLASQIEMGMVDCSYLCEKIISDYDPRILVMIGVCGGRPSQVKIGDILIPKKIVTYQRGKLTDEGLDLEVHTEDLDAKIQKHLDDDLFKHEIPGKIFSEWRRQFSVEYVTPGGEKKTV